MFSNFSSEVFKPGFSGFKAMQEVQDIKEIYKFGKKLGSGSFGTVYRGVYLKTRTPVAIKTINKSKLRERNNSELLQTLLREELRLASILEHPHIVRAFGLCEDDEEYYLAFELMRNGNLAEVLRSLRDKRIPFTEYDAAHLVRQVLMALSYLHSDTINVTHRDLKLENVMVAIEKRPDGSAEMVCKVTDFGFATAMDPSGKETLALGTTAYMAPEIVRRQAYDKSVDIWALGVMAYKMLTDAFPFVGKGKQPTKQATQDAIVNNDLDKDSITAKQLLNLLSIIKTGLFKNPLSR